ncbi:DUF927 domain-containing protein [Shewanella cyperi]|uniref:DUF927 domain-containing protein n=1 Tax=Shewanella cyperi TaxID=2814292 RepID=UPI00224BA542|nr:DUF927 domain-containing protein [Shewanella cyperi]
MLVDTGYPLTPGQPSWARLQHYLLEQMALATPATVVNRTGWHGSVFATSSWTVGSADEPHHFVGQLSGAPLLEESGSLSDWQHHVGKLCRGNPMAIFSIGAGLAAPLLAPSGMENGAFHFVGASSAGKTTLLQIAASLYGGDSYRRSWISTSNGLAAVSSEHNDMLLTLDEIGMARPEDVDTAIYQIMNGSGKLRANMSGELAATSQWRTLVVSSGEVWIAELLQRIGKPLRAGQQIRLVEIPVFGVHGAFDELHGHKSPQLFVDELKSSCQRYHGTVIREWLSLLTERHDELSRYLNYEIGRLSSSWISDSMASQVQRVIRRFALIGTALCLANRNFILPWSEEESLEAVHRVLKAWLANRGHSRNSEEFRLLRALEKAMRNWERSIGEIDQDSGKGVPGYRRTLDGCELWLINRTHFLQRLGLPTHYMREVEILLQRDCLVTNERSRGTYKTRINGEFQRFFALKPDQVRRHLEDLERVEHDD